MDKVLSNGAYIVDYSHHGREVSGSRCAKGPYIGVFQCKLMVHHGSYTVRYIGKSASSYAKEFVRSDIGSIHAPVFYIHYCVRRMLHCVRDHIDLRIDFFYPADKFFDVHNIAGDIGCCHNADKAGVLIHILHYFVYINAACLRVGRDFAEFPASLGAGILHGVMRGGMLQAGSNGVLSPFDILQDHIHDLEHGLGSGKFSYKCAAFCAKDDFQDFFCTF